MLTYILVPVCGELKSPGFRRLVCFSFLLSLIFFFSLALPANADVLEDAARQFTQKITGALPAYVPTFLSVENLSSLSDTQVSSVRSALQSALRNAGYSLSSEVHSQGLIHITLSESLGGYLWIAEVRRGEAATVLMMSFDSGKLEQFRPSSSLTIRREFLWEQEQPILDVTVVAAGGEAAELGVLERGQFSTYFPKAGGWTRAGVIPLPKSSPWPRDSRGLLYLGIDAQGVSLQGENCRFDARQASVGWKCQPSKTQQPLASDAESRVAGRKGPPWFSAATFQADGKPAVVISGIDGQSRLYGEGAEPVATFSGWGSEIASIQSGCDSGWELLVTGKGDWTSPDTIQAFEIREHRAAAVSAALEFPGPVTALHSAEDSKTAIAVVKNLRTHHYEAYRLAITCER